MTCSYAHCTETSRISCLSDLPIDEIVPVICLIDLVVVQTEYVPRPIRELHLHGGNGADVVAEGHAQVRVQGEPGEEAQVQD